MMTEKQIKDLAQYYQIDNFTIRREYLQILFLNYLYQQKKANKIYFKGGTAIRLIFGSSRFSEDLDFSTLHSKIEIKKIIESTEASIQKELPSVKIKVLHIGVETSRFRLWYQPPDIKYPLVIRLDFNEVKRIGKTTVAPLVTKFPVIVFPLINYLSATEILAEKICALLTRAKGRDFFDVWYLLEKGIPIIEEILKQKLQEQEAKFDKKNVLQKIKSYPQKQLDLDLKQFLPKSQRKIIGMLKNKLEDKFAQIIKPAS